MLADDTSIWTDLRLEWKQSIIPQQWINRRLLEEARRITLRLQHSEFMQSLVEFWVETVLRVVGS